MLKIEDLKENCLYENKKLAGWCRNGTFELKKYKDGRIFLRDTYWSTEVIDEVWIRIKSDKDLKGFKFLFNYDEVTTTHEPELYNKKDVIIAATGSGGWEYGTNYYIKKGTKKSKVKIKQKLKRELINAEDKVKWIKSDLERLEKGEYYLG